MPIVLTVVAGPHVGKSFTFAQHENFLVGRSPDAHFSLPDEDRSFSRLHFLVEVNPPRCRVLDLNSRNGTFVNGVSVRSAELMDGDEIRAGDMALRVTIVQDQATLISFEGTVPAVSCRVEGGLPSVPGYRMVRELGRGGMGCVYLAQRESDGAKVAIKTILPDAANDRREVRHFLREANILHELRHINIVSFYEVGEADGRFYFVMDYVSGPNAAHLLKAKGPLSVRFAVRIAVQLLRALGYAHDRGFVHRDVKPANVLLARRQQRGVRLSDFGLARLFQSSKLSGLTLEGQMAGTLPYMAPEQITNFREAKPPADQYSAAATLYNLLTGKQVYDFDRVNSRRLQLILNEDPVPIQQRRPELPEGLTAVIHQALHRDPSQRHPNVRAFLEELLPFGR
jgi:serine/threonine-protein kinase